MAQLARKLTFWDYLALGFGTMIGIRWVILIDGWLGRGGMGGAGHLVGDWDVAAPAGGHRWLKRVVYTFEGAFSQNIQ